MHVRLAIIAGSDPDLLERAVNSASHLVRSACVVIPTKKYDLLPQKGLSVATHVHQVDGEITASKLYELASKDEEVTCVLIMSASDALPWRTSLDDLPRTGAVGVDSAPTPVLIDLNREVQVP